MPPIASRVLPIAITDWPGERAPWKSPTVQAATVCIHPGNLAATCFMCHPGANENFAKGKVHVIATAAGDDEKILYYIATAYIVLIVLTIGGMFIHNLLDFIKKAKRQLMYRRGLLERKQYPPRLYVRMSLNERIQHGILAISFMILVLTGFALRFPEVTLISAHWGGGLPFYELMPEVAKALRNVYYDTAASLFLYRSAIFPAAVAAAGAKKILWGTDYPLIGQRRFLAHVGASGLDPDARADILGGNAAQLLRLGQE